MSGAWSFYSLADGYLTGVTYVGPEAELAVNIPAGCGAVAGIHDRHQVRLNLETNSLVPGRAPPPPDGEVHTWVFDESAGRYRRILTLDRLRALKSQEINEWRLQANRGNFTFSGKQIQCDEVSRSDIDGVSSIVSLTGQLPATFPGQWKCADNTYLPIPDTETWRALVAAMVAKGTEHFAHSQALKAYLQTCSTPEQIEQIHWGMTIPGA